MILVKDYISAYYQNCIRLIPSCLSLLVCLLVQLPQGGWTQQDAFLNDYLGDSDLWSLLVAHPPEWFTSQEAENLAAHVLEYQNQDGGWPKNIDFTRSKPRFDLVKKNLRSTIDNGATFTQLTFLGRLYTHIGNPIYEQAFNSGFDYLIEAQYENGGWPQYYPLRKGYYTHITYNDNAMIGVLQLLQSVVLNHEDFRFVDSKRRQSAQRALASGIECILATQVIRQGERTAWCAQHDEKTLKPAPARRYELISLSGKESVGILLFLMSIKEPDQRIQEAVHGGIKWMESVQLHGFRIDHRSDPGSEKGWDKVVVQDSTAEALWARFYDIDTDTPFLSDRDGLRYHDLAEISAERRNDYGWYGTWPKLALKAYHQVWSKKWPK